MIIDVSKWQGKIDWEKVKPDCDFAIIRASCGTTEDVQADRNMEECARLGIPYHAYHYLMAKTVDGIEKEGCLFAEVAAEHDPLFLVLDCEYSAITNAERKKRGTAKTLVEAFIAAVKDWYATFTDKTCPPIAVYIGHHLYTTWNLDYDSFAYVWIPRWNGWKKKPSYPCDLWQGSFTSIGGISKCDLSVLNGDKPMEYFTNKQEAETMAVTVGSARIDENGKAKGGKAGDQTGKEVATQNWYLHSKGWYVLRCTNDSKAAKIAKAMKLACASKYIGYDQYQRNTLYNAVKGVGFDLSQLDENVETDCSALVRVCCAYAGIPTAAFYTATEKKVLMETGMFAQLEGDKYEKSSEYLKAGDILVTKTKGHTVVVLNDGPKVEDLEFTEYALGDRELSNGCVGDDVRELQERLIELGYSCGDWGADGEFGDCTELAVQDYQEDIGFEVTGVADTKTVAVLLDAEEEEGNYLEIRGGNCWLRDAPSKEGKKLCVLKRGCNSLKSLGHEDGWYHVKITDESGVEGYVSDKYAVEVDGL